MYSKPQLQKSIPSRKKTKGSLQKVSEEMVAGPFSVFSRKTVVDKTSFRESAVLSKVAVPIETSKLYPGSMCQLIQLDLTHPEVGVISKKRERVKVRRNFIKKKSFTMY